jgi:hypothetical protein
MISEKTLAASITPAPKPNSMSCVRSDTRCENTMGKVPSAVASAATAPPVRAWSTTGRLAANCQNCAPSTSTPASAMAMPAHWRSGGNGHFAAAMDGELLIVIK